MSSEYQVAISYSSDAFEYAAGLYRRLPCPVFLDRACGRTDVSPDDLLQIYRKSRVIAIVAGNDYTGRGYTELECTEATSRLTQGRSDGVQLIKIESARLPPQVQAVESMLHKIPYSETVVLTEATWPGRLDRAATLIANKLQRLSPAQEAPTGAHPNNLPIVPFSVERHLKALRPLFDSPGTEARSPDDLLRYAHAGAQGCASLCGQIEQMLRSATLVERLKDLSCQTSNTGERMEQFERRARDGALRLLDVLCSPTENEARLTSDFLVPDYGQLTTRFGHYLRRHLDEFGRRQPAIGKLASHLLELLYPANNTPRRALIESISADASIVAGLLHDHFVKACGDAIVPDDTSACSPEAMLFGKAQDAIQRKTVRQ